MVTLMLLDQVGKKHIIQCFKPEATSSSFWRPESDMNVASGCPKFAPLSVLSNPSYVRDDTMFFKPSIIAAAYFCYLLKSSPSYTRYSTLKNPYTNYNWTSPSQCNIILICSVKNNYTCTSGCDGIKVFDI